MTAVCMQQQNQLTYSWHNTSCKLDGTSHECASAYVAQLFYTLSSSTSKQYNIIYEANSIEDS